MDRRRLSGELQRAHCEPDRVAGKGRWPTAARGPGDRPGIARSGTQCRTHFEFPGGTEVPRGHRGSLATFLKFTLLVLALVVAGASIAAERIVSSRVWPAQEYTRVTLESARPIRHQFFFVTNPSRLVLDIYPAQPADPLLALVGPRPDPIGEIAGAPLLPPAPGEANVETPPLPVLKLDPGRLREPVPKLAAKKVDRLVIIAIDAGHGGEDSGARGRHGTREKDVTLAIARLLKARIDQEPNMRAVMVRDGDYFVELKERVNKSQRVRADLFVSIHADAWVRPDARGSSVFALSERGATSTAARILAQRENESDLIGGVNLDRRDPVLKRVILDLSLTATINDSLK